MKSNKKVLSATLALTLAVSPLGSVWAGENTDAPQDNEPAVTTPEQPTPEDTTNPSVSTPTVTTTTVPYNDGHQDMEGVTVVGGLILVNKNHPVPENYVPDYTGGAEQSTSLRGEANTALQNFLAACNAQGHSMYVLSGYRGYNVQKNLFASYAAYHGEALANTYSARAGQSEHQTGLAFDVGDAKHSGYNLQTYMDQLASIQWMMANCAEYGFILRYPKGKEAITGYQYEPWHYRYVGVEAARAIMYNGLTLEEFLGDTTSGVTNGRQIAIGRSSNAIRIDDSFTHTASYNIGGNNYFRLRDLATLLRGTEAEFDLGYDDATRTITMTSHTALSQGDSLIELNTNDIALPNNMTVMVDNWYQTPTAYNINGFTYFKLRDLANLLGFYVDWDQENMAMVIDTTTTNTNGSVNLLSSILPM